ncbi:LOW QUALITY PROTEIN: Jacalin domain-containing protein, partial [Cephalotus follicularis]
GKDQQNGQKKCIIFVGPGLNGGTIWDDGTYNGVRQITLNYGDCIDSIRMVYDKNGTPITADKHGGFGGYSLNQYQFKLHCPEEYLISACGHYCSYRGSTVIKSLTFKIQRRTFSPFGVEVGIPFTLTMEGGQIVGFKGRSVWYLDSIGIHVSRVQSTKLFGKVKKGFQRLANSNFFFEQVTCKFNLPTRKVSSNIQSLSYVSYSSKLHFLNKQIIYHRILRCVWEEEEWIKATNESILKYIILDMTGKCNL